MADSITQVPLKLNPERLASIIDAAVLATNEIVALHFNALAHADLEQAAQIDGKFRLRGPKISGDERRALHESWILAKAFQELLRAVRHSLEEAYLFIALLTKIHRIKSSTTLSDFLYPIKRKAAALKFPDLFEAVNAALEPKMEFSAAYKSLQAARNCLEHRGGIVSRIETHGAEEFEISIPRMKMFYLRNNEEIELQPGEKIDPGDDRTKVDILAKIEIKKRPFKLGDRIIFSPEEFNEITFACHFLGQQLATRIPKQKANLQE